MIFRAKNDREMDWRQFAAFLSRVCRQRFGGRYPDVADEAFSQACLDLLEKWMKLPKAVNPDGTYRLEYAVWYGVHRYDRYYKVERKIVEGLPDDVSLGLYTRKGASGVSKELENDLLEFLGTVDQKTLQDWFQHLDGSSEEQAKREGVSGRAVRYRRLGRKRAMKRAWREYWD